MKKKYTFFEILISIVFIVYFIASIVFMYHYSKMEDGTPYFLMTFGQIMLVFGVLAFLSQIEKVKFVKSENHSLEAKFVGIIVAIVGAVLLIGSYLYIKTNIVDDTNVGIIVALTFMIFVDAYSIGNIIVSTINKKRALNYKEVEAKLIERHVATSGANLNTGDWHSNQCYFLKFEYIYDGEKNIYQPVSACDYMEIGTKIKVKVNPNDIKEVIWEELNSASMKNGIAILILGTVMTIGIVIAMLV